MRALITGITGFVGKYLEKHLILQGAEVFGTSRNSTMSNRYYTTDLSDNEDISRIIKKVKPTHIFHLAGFSNVKESWKNIKETFESNTMKTINLLDAVAKTDSDIRVITIGSSEEYGMVHNPESKIAEETSINPSNPYGMSKAAISQLIKQYHQSCGLDVVHLRPFNHIGPGQRLGFVTSDFAYQIAMTNKRKTDKDIKVGNLEAVRDFTDVRDIVKAYYLIAQKGQAGEIYNVSSGKGTKIQAILDLIVSFSDAEVKIVRDKERLRPSDIPFYVGNNSKLKKITNWEPEITLHQSLKDIYDEWVRALIDKP